MVYRQQQHVFVWCQPKKARFEQRPFREIRWSSCFRVADARDFSVAWPPIRGAHVDDGHHEREMLFHALYGIALHILNVRAEDFVTANDFLQSALQDAGIKRALELYGAGEHIR